MTDSEAQLIGGLHPVLEALRARGRTIQKLYMAHGRSGDAVAEIAQLARRLGLKVQRVDRLRLDQMYGRAGHQGVVAVAGPYAYAEMTDILDRVSGNAEGMDRAVILVLDGVQDPMNLGSLIRTSNAAGVAGLVIPRERSAPVSGAALKAAAGAAETVPVARVVNIPRMLEELKEAGFWIVGADGAAPRGLYQTDLPRRMALVVGGEGKGLGRLVRERCDYLVSIPLTGTVGSLNAAVAGAVVLFEHVRQHPLTASEKTP